MANYLIVAQEDMYRGGHGIVDWTIEECKDEQEAFSIGHEMSLDLIDSYHAFYDYFRENAEYWADQMEEEGEYFNREDYINQAIEEQREDAVVYYCYRLRDDFDYSQLNKGDIDWEDIRDIYSVEEY